MTTQTNCSICSNPLRRNGVWCFRCGTYMHIKCSVLKRGKDHTHDFVCERCCSNDSHQSESPVPERHVNEHPIPEPNTDAHGPNSTLEAADFWTNLTESDIEKVKLMYEEAALQDCRLPRYSFARAMDCLKLP